MQFNNTGYTVRLFTRNDQILKVQKTLTLRNLLTSYKDTIENKIDKNYKLFKRFVSNCMKLIINNLNTQNCKIAINCIKELSNKIPKLTKGNPTIKLYVK